MSKATILTDWQLTTLAALRSELRELREARADRDTLISIEGASRLLACEAMTQEVRRYEGRAIAAAAALETAMKAIEQ